MTALDVDQADTVTLRRWLHDAARLQAALDRFGARAAARLGDSSQVRGATRCTQREADQAVARGLLIEAIPEIGDALATGDISAAHVDTLAVAAERTSVDAVAGSDLLGVAKAEPADAMRSHVTDFVRRSADADHAARLDHQRRNRRAVLFHRDMGVLHAEFDDLTFAQVRAAIDAETDRLYHHDGGRDHAGEVRTPQQRRADAIAALLTHQAGRSAAAGTKTTRPPAVRNQMLIVAHIDGAAELPGIGPLPRSEVDRLACISDLYGLVFDTDGRPLWHGDRVQLADDNQWRMLIAHDGGCIACAAHPSQCQAHHITWRRHDGPTDIENLVLVCAHHHHLIHDKGWTLHQQPDSTWTLHPP
ncbi:MAG: DUF222 domain-containing protein [Acidimicrobiales bacterium]